jgi:hypothetical protein
LAINSSAVRCSDDKGIMDFLQCSPHLALATGSVERKQKLSRHHVRMKSVASAGWVELLRNPSTALARRA